MRFFNYEYREFILIPFLAAIAVASGADLLADLSHGATTEHVVKEAGIIILSLAAITWLLLDLRRQKLEIIALKQALEAKDTHPVQPKKYVMDARKNLGGVIARQFEEWSLTASEAEVGWLLLKGLSLKEIAIVRNTLEKTVRQQASAIYRKAGLDGRHAFAAWFIEDIL